MQTKILIIYPRSSKQLGLWSDLEDDPQIILRSTDLKKVNLGKSIIRKIHLSKKINTYISIPMKYIWYEYSDMYRLLPIVDKILIIDGALNHLSIKDLERCRRINPSVEINLFLLNSLLAGSPILKNVRPKISQFDWNGIYTFDPQDALTFGYVYTGFSYYSMKRVQPPHDTKYDVYFVGGLKGNRNDLIFNVFTSLHENNLKCKFQLYSPYGKYLEADGINYSKEWIPYDAVLSDVVCSNCILEILQKNQHGATLRYFEAVCYNKKLLTNNKDIVNYPYYNPYWMKIFEDVEDSDLDWVVMKEYLDYKYNGDFSPRKLINILLKNE